jgi:hypothetical protein
MDLINIIENNKTIIGGLSIAIATVIAVFINLNYSRRSEYRLKQEQNATFSSAIAAELLDNAHNLMAIHYEIAEKGARIQRINQFKEFNLLVYQNLLTEIGRLGPALSFMVVDIYGDIQKIKKYLEYYIQDDVLGNKQEILLDLQAVLAKSLTGSIMMAFYADYMLGPKWMSSTTEQRALWLENTLDDFCSYISRTEIDPVYIADPSKEFIECLQDEEQKQKIIHLFTLVEKIQKDIRKKRAWQVQLILRAFSYKLHNTIIGFLDIEPDSYMLKAEKEYKEFLP